GARSTYARRWGYGELVIVNVYAYRSTSPRDMERHAAAGVDIVGPDNDAGITDPPWHARLAADYAIDVSQVGSLLSLKYSFDSPMEVPVVRECRGAVVHESGKIVALPYAKFWNHGEAMAATIDWESARVLEKL